MNLKEVIRDNYLIKCNHCKEGCDYCNNTGKQYIGTHMFKFRILQLNREIPYLWSILKHELDIPYEYFHDDGLLIEKENKTDFKAIYKNIFNDFIKLKKEKEEVIKLLELKEYEIHRDKYTEAKPYRAEEVCVRCKEYNDTYTSAKCSMCKNNCCYNERVCFTPVTDKAKAWYNDGGYKFNENHSKDNDYTV